MTKSNARSILIAAAVIDDLDGRLLLVRKAGTDVFMQAGGKIETSEDARTTLQRELTEEIGLELGLQDARYLGRFSAPAANESGFVVEAELFHVRTTHQPITSSDIIEAVWVRPSDALGMQLAPLTRNCVLRLAESL